MKIGFIGLGNMGEPMALNLIKKGHTVLVYDIIDEKLLIAEKKGCIKKDSVKSAVKDVDFVITMLPEGRHVKEAYLNNNGIINNISQKTILIDCSTIDIETTKVIGAAAFNKQINMLDAPVSGGTAGAEKGTLAFMVGGNKEVLSSCMQILSAMGKNIVHVGELGAGQAAKACNNMLLAISMVALGEAFTLAKNLGLKQKTFFEISSKGTGMSWAMLNHLPVKGIIDTAAANNEFKPGFAANMMLKDLSLAKAAADSVHFKTQLGSLTQAIYEKFVSKGGGDLDYSAVIKLIDGTQD